MKSDEKERQIILDLIKRSCEEYYDISDISSVKQLISSRPPTRQRDLIERYLQEHPEEYDDCWSPEDRDRVKKNVQARFSKTLKRMIGYKQVYKNENNFYFPYDNQKEQVYLEDKILKSTVFDKPTAFRRGDYEILLPIRNAQKAIPLFRSYIGEKHLYAIMEWGDYVIVMLKNEEESYEIAERLMHIVEKGAHNEKELSSKGTQSPFRQGKGDSVLPGISDTSDESDIEDE